MIGMRKNIDVAIQDQTTPTIIVNFNKIVDETTLATITAIGDHIINVADASAVSAGSYIIIFSIITNRYYFAHVLSKNINELTLDSPIDSIFPIGSIVTISVDNMAINGSATPQIFGIRGTTEENAVIHSIDITRIIFTCMADSAVDLSSFGNIAGGLTKGLVLRHRNSEYHNCFNVKTNADIANIAFDFTVYQSINPVQGVDGFVSRLTFAGQEKMGVVKRLDPGDDLEFYIQDNLSTLTSLYVIAEGHEVLD